jgi:flagellar motility protein MotE (MotC chaperone)
MTRQRLYLPSLAAILFMASAPVAVCGAEPAATWGWNADEGSRPVRPSPPAPRKAYGWHTALVAPQPQPPENNPPAPAPETPAAVKSYCENIADAALDARFLSQKAELTRLEEALSKRTALLEAKKVEYQEWLKRRDEFINKAEGSLVKLYSKIKPDTAAPQLAAIDEEAAAALLLKLSAKTSSAILDQMETAKAARLVSVMIGAAKPSEKASPQNASADQAGEAQKDVAQPQNAGNRS